MSFRELIEHFTEIGVFNGYTFSKTYHCSQARKGSCTPRDGGMTKTKYINIIKLAIQKGLDFAKENYIVWKRNGKYNGLILTKPENKNIFVKTVMLKQKTKVLSKVKSIDITKEYNQIYNK